MKGEKKYKNNSEDKVYNWNFSLRSRKHDMAHEKFIVPWQMDHTTEQK